MNLGVIVGRFQVPELHEGHIKLIEHVQSQFPQVLILLGVSQVLGSKRHPLDYVTRERMIHERYPSLIVAPLPDMFNDGDWSAEVDRLIKLHCPEGKVMLYGGRDSFKPFYSGRHEVYEIETGGFWTGTDIRKLTASQVRFTSDFRAGVIYGISNQYERTYPTVDIAVVRDWKVLLAKKPGQDKWRFPGGFVSQNDTSMEISAKREVQEETGVTCEDMIYVCSNSQRDWRYSHPDDGAIMTTLFASFENKGTPKASDDIENVKWFDLNHVGLEEEVVPEHVGLMKKFLERLREIAPDEKKKVVGWSDKGR